MPTAFWPALWLAVVLAAAKAFHWSLPEARPGHVLQYLKDVAVSAHADVAFAAASGLLAAAVLWLLRGRPRLRHAAWMGFAAYGALCALYAVASIRIFDYLRSPLTYSLLYLAGDMTNMRSSIGSFVDASILVALLASPVAYVAAVRATHQRPLPAPLRSVGSRVAATAALAVVLWLGRDTSRGRWSDRDDHLIARSPHWELLSSYGSELVGLPAGRIDVPFDQADLADFEGRRSGRSTLPAGWRPRNVVLVVLESLPARYTSLHGGPYDATPNLAREARHALVFDAFYCHVGQTANALASLSLSLYPYMTWREYTVEYPDYPGRSIANVVKQHGYQTGLFYAGDLAYTNQRAFLQSRGFDALWDMTELAGGRTHTSWGAEDRYVVDGVFRWLDAAPRQPFYAQLWTIQSHHPYEPSPDRPFVDFFEGRTRPEDEYDLGRFLNTVLEADRQMGRLFDGLRERGLAEDTVVVVTGDHGEAFGEVHRTWGHGARVFEENVRVPLMVWSPRLFPNGGRRGTVGGHVDLNPTLADLLRIPPDASWEGRSLFDPERPPRTYFYAANDDYLLGVREGRFKYVYNATLGRETLYDLEADPEERRNLAASDPERCHRLRQRLAAWRDFAGRQLARARAAPDPVTALAR
jgi:phosphoglycerol transferase MdoB-like AlkP superfamily enzyme